MRLSHTIALSEFCLAYLAKAFPQLKNGYALVQYPNGGFIANAIGEGSPKAEEQDWLEFIEKNTTGWYSIKETPINPSKGSGQISLEGELDRDHLLIKRIKNRDVKLSLLLQFSPFVLSTKQYMSAAEKKVVEISIKAMLEQIVLQRESDSDILLQLANNNRFQSKEIQELEQRLGQRNRAFGSSIRQLLKLLLSQLEKELSIEIEYDQSFIEGLGKFQGDFEELERQLSKQIELEANLAHLASDTKINLSSTHLKQLLSIGPKAQKRSTSSTPIGRLSKASSLLDRYERSAQIVQDAGLSIIGKHIGAHCTPPISNAAITDALSKNSKKIYELFQQFPNRWPIIRSEFRSVSNIIERESRAAQKVS